jgi:hypothetical protein
MSRSGARARENAGGPELLHFSSAALQNVKKGDSVTVELALRDNGPTPKTK